MFAPNQLATATFEAGIVLKLVDHSKFRDAKMGHTYITPNNKVKEAQRGKPSGQLEEKPEAYQQSNPAARSSDSLGY